MEDVLKEYYALSHAMQSGVQAELSLGDTSANPKYLRTGINSAMSDVSAIAKLLIAKGVFTEEEYYVAVRDAMRREVGDYERRLSARLGHQVKLL